MLDKVPLCVNDEVLYFESVPGLFDLVEGMQCHLLEVSRPPVDRGALIDHVKVLRDADEIVLGHGGLFEQGLAMFAVRGQLATQPLSGSGRAHSVDGGGLVYVVGGDFFGQTVRVHL